MEQVVSSKKKYSCGMETAVSVPIHIDEKIERQTLDKKTQGFLQPEPLRTVISPSRITA